MNKLFFAFFLSFIFSIQPIIGQNNCFKVTIDSLTTNDVFLFVFTDISKPSNHKLILQREEKKNIFFDCFKISQKLRLQIFSMDFETYSQDLSGILKDDTIRLNIILKKKNKLLDEVTVKGKFERFGLKGDTLVVRLKDDDTIPHGSASSLFDRVKGLDNSNGLKVLGKPINTITVDGKKYFGGDSKLVLENVKADMIEQLEIIDFDSKESGGEAKALNIKLKNDKKNGIYGNANLAVGSQENNLLSLSANKINEKTFSNLFIRSNTINQNWETDRKSISISRNLFKNRSIISIYDNSIYDSNDLFSSLPTNSSNNTSKGINTISELGLNINKTCQKSELNILSTASIQKNSILENINRSQLNGNIFIKSNEDKEKLFQKKLLSSQIVYNAKFSPKFSFDLINELRFCEQNLLNIDNTDIIENESITKQQKYSNILLGENYIQNHLQFGAILKGNKIGQISSFLFKSLLEFPTTSSVYRNLFQTQASSIEMIQKIQKKVNYSSIDFEFIHTIPFNRRFLFEVRQNIKSNNYNLSQDLISLKSPFQKNSSNVYINHSISETGFYTMYQKKRFRIIHEQGLFLFNINRSSNELSLKDEIIPVYSPLLEIEYKLRNSRHMLKFTNLPRLPETNQLGALADSSNISNIVNGNIFLENTVEKKIQLSNSITHKSLNLTLSSSYSIISNAIISSYQFDFTRNLTTNTFLNFPSPFKNININLNGFIFNPDTGFNLFFLLSVDKTNGYIENQGKVSENENILGLGIVNSTIRFNKNIRFKVNLLTQLISNIGQLSSQNTASFNGSFEFSRRFYGQFDYKFNTTYNQAKLINTQNSINLDIYHFVGKNDRYKIGIIAKNIFNPGFETNVFSGINQVYTQKTNLLPQTYLLSLSIYPELWK